MNVPAAPWTRLPASELRFSVDDVRARCSSLPPPAHHPILRDVAQPRHAGLLVPVVDVDGEAGVVITKRPETMTYHRGDWVFPGGRIDPAIDVGPEAAARREASEELGVPLADVEVLGALDVYGPIVTGFMIHPFVGTFALGTELVPDPDEVAEVCVMRLSELLADGCHHWSDVLPDHEPGPAATQSVAREPRAQAMNFFTVRDDEYIWGTQGDILYDLLAHLVGG